MYSGTVTIGEWDSNIPYDERHMSIIETQDSLDKCVIDFGHIKLNFISLSIGGESVLVHLEKTICSECGYRNHWCAIPEYAIGNKSYSNFVSGLDILPCSNCGELLRQRGVIWKES
ncbi:MAG: hypothetical protein AAFQ14_02880 [Cyanobacteria bacterium J06621_12]